MVSKLSAISSLWSIESIISPLSWDFCFWMDNKWTKIEELNVCFKLLFVLMKTSVTNKYGKNTELIWGIALLAGHSNILQIPMLVGDVFDTTTEWLDNIFEGKPNQSTTMQQMCGGSSHCLREQKVSKMRSQTTSIRRISCGTWQLNIQNKFVERREEEILLYLVYISCRLDGRKVKQKA